MKKGILFCVLLCVAVALLGCGHASHDVFNATNGQIVARTEVWRGGDSETTGADVETVYGPAVIEPIEVPDVNGRTYAFKYTLTTERWNDSEGTEQILYGTYMRTRIDKQKSEGEAPGFRDVISATGDAVNPVEIPNLNQE